MDIDSVITKEEYESISSLTYEQFTDYLMRLVKLCVEESLKSLPAVVNHIAKEAEYLNKLSSEFYINNKDLRGHKKLVASVIETVEAEHPEMTYEEILQIAANKAKQIISSGTKQDGNLISMNKFENKLEDI